MTRRTAHMKRHHYAWYALGAVLALAPVGVRVLTWPAPRQHADDAAAAQAGHKLFVHDWTSRDPLSPRGDGLGPVFNASSCVACHNQAGVGGAGGLQHNVTAFVVRPPGQRNGPAREGVIHARATRPEFQETLKDIHPDLPPIAQPSLSQLLTVPGMVRQQQDPIP